MTDTKRTLFAGLLIGLLTLCIPFYLQMIGVMPGKDLETNQATSLDGAFVEKTLREELATRAPSPALPSSDDTSPHASLFEFLVVTDKYKASLSNVSGGSLHSFQINSAQKDGYRYLGGYNDLGEYEHSLNLDLILPTHSNCNPCLESKGQRMSDFFKVVSPGIFNGQTINLYGSDSLSVKMLYSKGGVFIQKTTTFYGDSYVIKHDYNVEAPDPRVFINWGGGLRTTEKNLYEELTYSSGYVGQEKEISNISLSPSSIEDSLSQEYFPGKTDWVAVRNKYFISSLISSDAVGGQLSARTYRLNQDDLIPLYSVGLEFDSPSFSVSQFFGPLDVDVIASSGTYLDRVMNFGWLPLQPFSRSVLWILKKLHLLGVNYGVILILFAFLIRIITGPLTKKSYKSTFKMQQIQPQLKKIQEKYKNDKQRLNSEMMKLYKTSGVNPLGGCLPMLLQMPLLFALFIVFRSTIEFRGAPFFWWINNLSQPDTIFNLPFNIPIYGDQVAFLPIVLGISMFMTQRLSMATMDKSQKPMMYMMSGFFFLLFNSFPSGLNLYYTMYNFLNYHQQRTLKRK